MYCVCIRLTGSCLSKVLLCILFELGLSCNALESGW